MSFNKINSMVPGNEALKLVIIELISRTFPVKVPYCDCQKTPLMISQHQLQ